MNEIILFKLTTGEEPFLSWIKKFEKKDRASINIFIQRVANGGSNKNIKSVGKQILEIKINRGPGYRVYFVKVDNRLLLLLGGDKSSQKRDIKLAEIYWRLYVSK